jgi:hypothetical protein
MQHFRMQRLFGLYQKGYRDLDFKRLFTVAGSSQYFLYTAVRKKPLKLQRISITGVCFVLAL